MENRFDNKTIIVTGGCRGIGKSIVERFVKEGAFVYALDYVIIPETEKFFENEEWNKQVKCVQTDVTDWNSVQNAIDVVLKEKKTIDVLINNAGITRDNLIIRMSPEDWDKVLDTNLKGAFLCCKAIAKPMMSQRYGRIINMGSIVGSIGNAGQTNYSSSKAGMIGLTKSLAKELGSRNILVNLVAPGYVQTVMTDVLTDDQKQEFLKNIPLRRAAEPKDIANVVSFLASEDASYLTGQVIHIDGGLAL